MNYIGQLKISLELKCEEIALEQILTPVPVSETVLVNAS
jgi:hypothetical protein